IPAIAVSALLSGALLSGCLPDESTSPTTASTQSTAAQAGSVDPACGGSANTLGGALQGITGPIGCPGGVNTYFAKELAPLGVTWTVPRFISYRDGEVPGDACGARDPKPKDYVGNAFYCRLDDTVAYSSDFLGELAQKNPTYPMFVLMHE